ncbi:MAG: phage tail sheath subtilisin-like domain-containing protein [Caldilineaceae bacterium]|nr:phage tail sheath subtilisin-like domain-containing protein [Caldilineaceae bacterium]
MSLTNLKSPGVFPMEVDKGTKPIEGVGTSIPAFVGMTAKAPVGFDPAGGVYESRSGKAVFVANWTQYVDQFGEFVRDAFLPDMVYAYFANGGGPCYVVSLRALDVELEGKPQTASVSIPSDNRSRTPSFVVRAKTPGEKGNNLSVVVESEEEGLFNLRIGDAEQKGLTLDAEQKNYVGNARFEAVEISEIGSVAPKAGAYPLTGGKDAPSASTLSALSVDDYRGSEKDRTGFGALVPLNIRLLVCPDIMVGYDGSPAAKERVKLLQHEMNTYCENDRYCFALLDTPPGMTPDEARAWKEEELKLDSSYAALYYPWIEMADFQTGRTKLTPPSGVMAGVYNRVDAERGVHKAPANEVLRGAIGLERDLSRNEQDILNPIGVNCIRAFPNRGIRAWGARTLSSDGSWRYINVRRLFMYVEASMEVGLQWVVFEPNNQLLWGKVRRDVTAFLRGVWRSGALFGASPTDGFYVKCDEELNPPDVRDKGILIIEVGMAPVKPAEFVIFRISQWVGADAEAEE